MLKRYVLRALPWSDEFYPLFAVCSKLFRYFWVKVPLGGRANTQRRTKQRAKERRRGGEGQRANTRAGKGQTKKGFTPSGTRAERRNMYILVMHYLVVDSSLKEAKFWRSFGQKTVSLREQDLAPAV